MLKESQDREVYVNGYPDDQYVLPCYTIPEASLALGRTQLTVKRWIRDRLIPPPQLIGSTSNYRYYSEGELQLIANALVEHEKEFNYLHHTHAATITNIWKDVEAYREEYV